MIRKIMRNIYLTMEIIAVIKEMKNSKMRVILKKTKNLIYTNHKSV